MQRIAAAAAFEVVERVHLPGDREVAAVEHVAAVKGGDFAAALRGLVLDKDGVKMSKRLGNVVDPWKAIGEHGADAVRWFLDAILPLVRASVPNAVLMLSG